MAEVMARWREEWVRSHEDGFFFTTAPSQFVQGAMARRRHYQWAGIPPSLVKQWDAERNSRMSRRRRRNARNENE